MTEVATPVQKVEKPPASIVAEKKQTPGEFLTGFIARQKATLEGAKQSFLGSLHLRQAKHEDNQGSGNALAKTREALGAIGKNLGSKEVLTSVAIGMARLQDVGNVVEPFTDIVNPGDKDTNQRYGEYRQIKADENKPTIVDRRGESGSGSRPQIEIQIPADYMKGK